MATVNVIAIEGNLGSDPESRFLPDGTQVTTFNIAVQRGYGDNKRTVWLKIETWRKTAEFCNNNLVKGDRIVATGALDEDSWDDKATGEKKHRTKIVANEISPVKIAAWSQGAATGNSVPF